MGKLTFQAAAGGTVDLVGPNTAATVTLNLPATSGDIIGTGSSGVVTDAMISGPISVAKGGTGVTTSTGTGSTVLSTSPTLVTPALGTPASGVLTNTTGLPLTTGVTGILPVANGGSGTTSPALVAGTNVTITGTWPNQTINSTAAGGGGGTVTSVAATVPAFLSIIGSPITTTGTLAIDYSGTALPLANGGTNATSAQGAINTLAGATTAGSYLRGNGSNVVMAAIQAGDVPTLNQNTTGTAANITGTSNSSITTLSALSLPGSQVSGNISGNAANVTGTVAIGNGGTGQTTASAAFNALSPVTTAGDLILGNGTNSSTRLGIGANGYVLTSDGTTASWAAGGGGGSGTVTSVAQSFTGGIISVTGSPVTTSGTLALTVAGTSGGIPYFSSGTTWASSAAGTAGQVLTSNGAAAPSWTTVGGLGTVTSVDVSGGTTGLTTSGGPITTTGTITLGGTLAVANGGTGVTTSTGSGSTVLSTSPTLVTPILGTPTSGNLSNCTADGTNSVGYLNVPQNAQTGAYTLVLADGGKHIYHASGAAAATYTIPVATSVAYPIGTVISFVNLSANNVTIAITTDTMYLVGYGSTGSRTLSQYGVATATKVSGTSSAGIWIISGVGLT
jgi:hypothetical protein